jgi:hypothetical protein
MRKRLISAVSGMLALGVLWAPLAQGAPMPSDPCDILSGVPSGYASCKADEANVPGFREQLQQQQQQMVGNCADETEANTQACLQAREGQPTQIAGAGPPQGDQFKNLFPDYNLGVPNQQPPIVPIVPQNPKPAGGSTGPTICPIKNCWG